MDKKAMYKLSYGLFVLSAREDGRDNACIINTAVQVTTSPNRITIAVNKQNLTHDMVMNTGEFNISILDQSTPFAVFGHFGLSSGRDKPKFVSQDIPRMENGIFCLEDYTCACISARVVSATDLGTHTLFLADVTDARLIADTEPATYAYYQSSIKPAPEPKKVTGWRCEVCGYVYEGDPLPEGFVCPLCKHGPEDFVKIEA